MGAFDFIDGDGPGAVAGRTAVAGIVGGTASALGGGKFANGAYTAAFQHLLNAEMETSKEMLLNAVHDQGKKWYYWLYNKENGSIENVANGSQQYGSRSLKGQCAVARLVAVHPERQGVLETLAARLLAVLPDRHNHGLLRRAAWFSCRG
jgi:hypothetical protein